MRQKRITRLAVVTLSIAVFGCSPSKPPFLIAQLCLKNESGKQKFVASLQEIAPRLGGRFYDRSAESTAETAEIKRHGTPMDTPDEAIEMAIRRSDGIGVSVSNLGLSTYEVALGFSGVSDSNEAQHFARSLIDYLGRQWKLSIVPEGRGASPSSSCGESRQAKSRH